MTRRLNSFVVAVVVVAALSTGAAFAQGPRAGGPGRAGGRGALGGLPIGALNLTQAQQDLVRDIRERGRDGVGPLDERLRAAQEGQRTAIDTLPINEGAIRTATLALAEVQADVAIHQARIQNEIWNVLTADQQAEVKKRQAERDNRRPARRQ